MEQPKKKSKAQLENEIAKALVFVPHKGAKTVRMDDRGITITVTDDYTVISTNFHRNVFTNYNSTGVSYTTYLVGEFVRIIERHQTFGQIKDDKGNITGLSFEKIMSHRDEIEEIDFNILRKVDIWLMLLTEPLFILGTTETSALNMNAMFISFLSKANCLLSNNESDVMYNEFVNKYIASVRYLSLDNDVNCEGLQEEILKIETEAMDKLKAFVESKGVNFVDRVAISKRYDDNEGLGA